MRILKRQKNRIKFKMVISLISAILFLNFGSMMSFSAQDNIGFEKALDDFIEKELIGSKVPGFAVVVVKDGKVLLEKGYGYSDIENKKKVNPFEDQFPIASVTKLFTTTSVLQLAEEGQVSLDEDLNKYLKSYKVENNYSNALTLRHLITNTGGFAESIQGVYYNELFDEPILLDKTIKENMPKLVRNPGEVIQYSNHGFALAGYVVENVLGMDFNEYVEKNIFEPLKMNNTSYFLGKLNKDVIPKGYVYGNQGFSEKELGTIAVYPAGSITSSVSDMGKFLLANINNGELNGNRILNAETAKAMKTVQFTQNSEMPGYGLGFYQNSKNGEIFMHDGDTETFTSQISLHPKEQIGYFISYNIMDEGKLRDKFEEFFYGYYQIPLEQKDYSDETFLKSEEDLSSFAGSYVFAQRIRDGVLKIRGLFLKMSVRFDENNNLKLGSFDSGVSGTYEHYKDNLFINRENNRKVFLKTGRNGQKYFFGDMKVPMQTMEKLGTKDFIFEKYVRNYVFLIPLFSIILWICSLFRKNKKTYVENVKYLKIITKIINILVFTVLLALMTIMFTQSEQFRMAIVIVANVIGFVILLFSGILVWKMILSLKENVISIWRLCYSLVVVTAGIGAVVYLSYLDVLVI